MCLEVRMNRLFFAIIIGMIVALCFVCTISAFAIDYVLGARAGFFFWRPFYKDLPSGTGFEDIRTGHGGLYGSILATNFTDRIGLSISGLMGQQTTQWHSWNNSGVSGDGSPYNYSRTSYVEANRYDLDSTLSYSIMPGFRLFIGYKFQYMQVKWYSTERIYMINDNKTEIRDVEFEFTMPLHGIAAGCGYSSNISSYYFFTVSLSCVYTCGAFNYDNVVTKYIDTGIAPPGVNESNPRRESDEMDVHQYGFNIEPSVGIRTSGPLVAIGIRYQLLRTQFYNIESSGGDGPDDRWMNDHLYGIFVSVMYVL